MVTTRAKAKREALVLNLPDACLDRVLALLPFHDVYNASLACSRLAKLARQPSSTLWGQVSLRRLELEPPEAAPQALQRLAGFVRWLQPRAGGVRVAEIDVLLTADTPKEHETEAWLLVTQALAALAPSLEVLRLLWGTQLTPGACVAGMPNLKEADFVAAKIELNAELAQATQLRDLWVGAPEIVCSGPACLPPRLSSLSFFHSRLTCLPPDMSSLTTLRCLDLTQNDTLTPDAYAPLADLPNLQELCASWCNMQTLPRALSALTSIRVLYLHSNFTLPGFSPSEDDWRAAFGGMSRLGMLSLSACHLDSVPAVVAGMTSLRCFHCEDNPGIRLIPGAYMSGLVELSIDWSSLMTYHQVLKAATKLRKLYVCGHHVGDTGQTLPAPDSVATWDVPAALASLQALHALEILVDVMPQTRTNYLFGPVAALMYQLPRRLPNLRIDVLASENYGWRLADVLQVEVKEGRAEEGAT